MIFTSRPVFRRPSPSGNIDILDDAYFVLQFMDPADNPVDGSDAVVAGKNHDRHGAAIAVEQAGVGANVLQVLAHDKLVAWQNLPAQAALVPAGIDHLGHHGQSHDALQDRKSVV